MTVHRMYDPASAQRRGATARPAMELDEPLLRAWLAKHARRLGIDEGYSSADITIADGLVRLSYALGGHDTPGVWTLHPPLESVSIWPTADDDGVDGGALITATLRINGHPICLACPHQTAPDFTDDDEDTCGIDAAVQALATATALVNHEVAAYLHATGQPTPHPHLEKFTAVLNAVTDDLLHVTDAGDEGLRDALNLTVNAAGVYAERGWHCADPAAARDRLQQVAADGYHTDLDTVLGWIAAGIR